MTVSHHLTDETLQDHAAGSLSVPMETLVACHLTVCAGCRERLRLAEDIGGAVVAGAEPVIVRAGVADVLTRARIKVTGPVAAPGVAGGGAFDRRAEISVRSAEASVAKGVPRPLGRLLPKPVDQLDWRRLAPGIKQYDLSQGHRGKGAFKLLHLAPGVVLSAHSHEDRELTYVVSGSYQDAMGRFKAGDIADLDGQHLHRPVVDTEEPCIALIATQSPVRYSGMLARLMQPFVGI